jgi:MIP family channel proteins
VEPGTDVRKLPFHTPTASVLLYWGLNDRRSKLFRRGDMAVAILQDDWKKVLAEVVGTFFFFFIGIGSIAAASAAGGLGLVIVALGHGLALSIAISALGHISGGHFNPAVTIGLLVGRKIGPVLALLYIIGQLIGGVLASLAVATVLPQETWQAFKLGTPSLSGINFTQGIILEAILTFFLVIAVFGTAVDPRATRIGGFGIGLTVFVDILMGGPFSGAVMNPARAIAPAIVSGNWNSDQIIYWIGPIIGGVIAALLYVTFFLPKGDEPVVEVPSVTDRTIEPPFSEPGLLKD